MRKPIGGKDYFYDLDKIREVGQWDVSKLNPIADNTTSLNNISLPSVNGTVNSNIRKSSKNNAKFSINEPKLSDIANLKPADANTNYRGIANEETLQKAQNIVLHTPLTSEYAKLDEARMRSKAFKFRG